MADDGNGKRNFRVAYYDKVGFRGIGEKALVAILKDDVIDRKKLENFCIRFPVPASYRLLIWKILLNILPIHQQSHKFVMLQRTEQYNDLHHALKVMKKIDDSTIVSEVFLQMYLLESGKLGLKFTPAPWHGCFSAVAFAVSEIVDSPVIAYWISVKLYNFFEENNYLSLRDEFNNIVTSTLKKENGKLFSHLDDLTFFNNQPNISWYKQCFASVLQCDGCLSRVWDILIGRAPRILPYLAVQIMVAFERQLLSAATLTNCLNIINRTPYSEEISDIVVHKGIEMWKKYEKIP